MSASKPQRQILTEDGELREADSSITPESRLSAVYCTNCGTSNRASSRFCRTCGESLDEQMPSDDAIRDVRGIGRKSKRSMERALQVQPAQSASSMAAEVVILFFVTGMVIASAAITNSVLLPIVILIAWVLVEMARHGVMH